MSEAERAIREALPFATPGRWEHVFSNGGREHYVYAPDAHYRRDLPGPVKVAWLPPSPGSNRDANDAAYIAACSPENIASILAHVEAQEAEIERLRAGLRAVSDLIDESHGVAGLHRNGDVAPWSDLRTGGKYEEWLVAFDDALKEQR